ncbi:MAG: WD40 repeat domain-containing protein [Chloroflexota bacterium]|nr:WD40 repeat domain-containing protein [Chloroflexota bacterium]
MRLRTHPYEREALILGNDTVSRWSFVEAPRLIAVIERAHHPSSFDPCLLDGSPDGATFAVTLPVAWEQVPDDQTPDCIIEFRRWSDFQVVDRLVIPESDIGLTSLAFSPNGRWMIAADYRIQLIDRSTKCRVDLANGHEWTTAVAFAPTSTRCAAVCTGQAGGHLALFAVNHGKLDVLYPALDRRGIAWPEPAAMDLADASGTITFSRDGALVAFYLTSQWPAEKLGWQGEILLYHVETGRRLWHVPIEGTRGDAHDAFCSDICFTPNGRYLVCGSTQGEVHIRDVADGHLVQRINVGRSTALPAIALHASDSTICAVVDESLMCFPLPDNYTS